MAVEDTFSKFTSGLESPARNAFAITPHDTNDLTYATRWLYVGGAGTLKIITLGGDTVTFGAVTAGSLIPVRATRVYDTGTSATDIVGLY